MDHYFVIPNMLLINRINVHKYESDVGKCWHAAQKCDKI